MKPARVKNAPVAVADAAAMAGVAAVAVGAIITGVEGKRGAGYPAPVPSRREGHPGRALRRSWRSRTWHREGRGGGRKGGCRTNTRRWARSPRARFRWV